MTSFKPFITIQVTVRVRGLALMTAQALAVVLSPALLLWVAEPVIEGRKVGRDLDMAAREWNYTTCLSGECVQRIFNFLHLDRTRLLR